MAAFNRNVITEQDITNLRDENFPGPKTLESSPPAGVISSRVGMTEAQLPIPTADGFLTTLLKYVPLEVVGSYLFIENLLKPLDQDWTEWALLALLLTTVLVALPVYMRQALNVVRPLQVLMGGAGMAVYVFALGGWFATQEWYHPALGSIGLAVYAFLVKVVHLPALPSTSQ